MKAFALSVCPLSLHLVALLCGEDLCPHVFLDEAFCHLNWYPSSWWGFHLLSSPWVVTSVGYSFCIFSVLVNPFAWCVWGGHVMHLVSPLSKTMLMLNAHPYISLLRCFAMNHTHRFWLSLFLSCLFYMLLNHLFVASARLCFFLVHLHLLWVSIDFRGVVILFCALGILMQIF